MVPSLLRRTKSSEDFINPGGGGGRRVGKFSHLKSENFSWRSFFFRCVCVCVCVLGGGGFNF